MENIRDIKFKTPSDSHCLTKNAIFLLLFHAATYLEVSCGHFNQLSHHSCETGRLHNMLGQMNLTMAELFFIEI